MFSFILPMGLMSLLLLVPIIILAPIVPTIITRRAIKEGVPFKLYSIERRILGVITIIVITGYGIFLFLRPVTSFLLGNLPYLGNEPSSLITLICIFILSSLLFFSFLGFLSYKYFLQSSLLKTIGIYTSGLEKEDLKTETLKQYSSGYFYHSLLIIGASLGMFYFTGLIVISWVISIALITSQLMTNDYKFYKKMSDIITEQTTYSIDKKVTTLKRIRVWIFILSFTFPFSVVGLFLFSLQYLL